MGIRRRFGLMVTSVATVPLVLAGCTAPTSKTEDRADPAAAAAQRAPAPTLALAPANDARDVPISTEISTGVRDGKVTGIKVTDASGAEVAGSPRPDDPGTWVPEKPLKNKETYRVEVTAANDAGGSTTGTSSFTTMDKSNRARTTSTLYFGENRTYGAAMPVTVAFDPPVPEESRADVQRRLYVRTEPSQPGTWSWLPDGSQVAYRAPDFWQEGTTISVRSALDGVPIGKNRIGDTDRSASSKIGEEVTMVVDNAAKTMAVYRGGKLEREMPVSLGKPSTPSSSGNMVVMEKHEQTVFDTRGEPNGGYVVTVQDAQRLTWGGEFIHSAPWSVSDQGVRNVSHGCANLSPANANWLMGISKVGDLVTVKGTEVRLENGNGWTAWNQSWDDFAAGSALPVPENLAPTRSIDPASPPPQQPGTSASPGPQPSGAPEEGSSGGDSGSGG
ncbi:Ig-like domain-containing protein [Melissospora conviva]|uniref:L,D-transpeptidase n=1 Tax=Melissospora conviva TaxID=3388432 RepID=UPI003C1E3D54